MGLFDYFSRKSENLPDEQSSTSKSYFTNKITKIICNTNEEGVYKCRKYTTSSNNHSGVPQYEEEDSEFDESSMPNIDIDQEFRNLSKSFGFSFGGFNDIFRELEEIQRDMQINTPFRPHFTQNPQDFQQSTRNPRDFQQSTSKTQPSQKDTNIYDI